MRHRLQAVLLALGIVGLSAALVYQPKPVAQAAVYKGVDGPAWLQMRHLDAGTYAGGDASQLGGGSTDFATTAGAGGWAVAVSGSGAVNPLTPLGGRLQVTTGATGVSTARVT